MKVGNTAVFVGQKLSTRSLRRFHSGDVISLLDENGHELSMKRKSTRGHLHI